MKALHQQKPDTLATKLAQTVNQRKQAEAKIEAVEAEYADELAHANEIVETIRAKIRKRTNPTLQRVTELKGEESQLREHLMNADYIGASFRTEYGTVSVEANPTPHVTRFSSIPMEFRKDPELCILGPKIKKEFKAGHKVPGVQMIDMPKVVVR